MEEIVVTVGQIWSDKDKRRLGRTIRVDSIIDNEVVCELVTAGMSKGRPLVKIRLDRFRPQYYALKDPVSVAKVNVVSDASSLLDRCNDEWRSVDWKKISQHTVGVDSGRSQIRIREVNKKCYDAKLLVNNRWVLSVVIRENLYNAVDRFAVWDKLALTGPT